MQRRFIRFWPLVALGLIGGGGLVLAQLDPGERGVAPIDSSSSYEVANIAVDVSGRTADAARMGGWRQAQRLGWKALWGHEHNLPAASAPGLPDSTLDAIVAGIVVEDEQIGPMRYVAHLGILFDRARTGQLLGIHGQGPRSAPMLVIPVMWSGGAPTSFELRNEWQKAWARFRAGTSAIDYVRPVGTGVDPLLLNVGQSGRRGRGWWRGLLDQYGAADVVVPEVHLERQWPGGPVIGRFTAHHGPDNDVVATFSLTAADSDDLPKMLDEGVRRIDDAYSAALLGGRLRTDASLVIEEPAALDDALAGSLAEDPVADITQALSATPYTLQVDTPDAASVGQIEGTLRGIPGMSQAGITSLALGGVSVLRLAFNGDLATLRIALSARGWRIDEAGGELRLRRQGRHVIARGAGRRAMNQIALPLDWPVDEQQDEFILSPANAAVTRHLEHWSLWPVMATIITGPRKSGRSLIGRLFARQTRGRLIDDAERRDEEDVFHAWNAAQATRRPLVILADAAPPDWAVRLPDLASRLAATPRVEILPPDDALIGALLDKALRARGLFAPPALTHYLLPRIERSYVAVQRVVDALDRAALSRRSRLSVPLARRALEEAGVIDAL